MFLCKIKYFLSFFGFCLINMSVLFHGGIFHCIKILKLFSLRVSALNVSKPALIKFTTERFNEKKLFAQNNLLETLVPNMLTKLMKSITKKVFRNPSKRRQLA